MEQWYIENNTTERYDTDHSEISLYQRLRATDGRVMHLNRHLDILCSYAAILLPKTPIPTTSEVEQLCHRLLSRGSYNSSSTHILELRLWQNGRVRLSVIETSLYKGFDLRVLRPNAAIIEGCGTALLYPTSAALECEKLMKIIARQNGCDVALAVQNSSVIAIDGTNPIAVHGTNVTIGQSITSAYTEFIIEALKKLPQYNILLSEISLQQAASADELFFADHRGLTAIGTLGGRQYSDTVAYAIAKYINR